MMKPLAIVVVAVVVIVVASARANADGGLECKDIAKGDVAACKEQSKARCTSTKYWDRRKCEQALVQELDTCLNGAYESACKTAWPLHEACDVTGFGGSGRTLEQMFDAKFVGRYNRVQADSVEFGKFHAKWSACYGSSVEGCPASTESWTECQRAPAKFAKIFATEVDDVLSNEYLDKAREVQTAKNGDELGNASNLASEARRQAQLLLDVNGKLRAELRYKEPELRKIIDGADGIDKAEAQKRAKEVAGRVCPRGKKAATGAFLKLVQAAVRKVKTQKLKAVPIMGSATRSVDRGSLITQESVPAYVCVEDNRKGKRTCTAQSISFYREKAPASPWTSWDIAWGGDSEVSCK